MYPNTKCSCTVMKISDTFYQGVQSIIIFLAIFAGNSIETWKCWANFFKVWSISILAIHFYQPRFYLGFIFWGRSPEWLKATSFLGFQGQDPQKFFEMNLCWDIIWCILRHNFEKCYSVCNDLVVSGWFFQYSYLYTIAITIFWGRSFTAQIP